MRRFVMIALTIIAQAVTAQAMASDTVLINGHIYTANPAAPWAQAIAITGSRIEAVGDSGTVRGRAGSLARVIDLKGKTVIPGIIDDHAHTLYGSLELHGFNLSTPEASITPEKKELLISTVKRFAAEHPSDKILIGRADFSTTPPSTPSHELLDEAVVDRPVVIHNTSEHALWLNVAAIKLAGLTDRPVSDPVGLLEPDQAFCRRQHGSDSAAGLRSTRLSEANPGAGSPRISDHDSRDPR